MWTDDALALRHLVCMGVWSDYRCRYLPRGDEVRRWLSRLFWRWKHPDSMSLDWLDQQDQQVREVYEGVCVDWPIKREESGAENPHGGERTL